MDKIKLIAVDLLTKYLLKHDLIKFDLNEKLDNKIMLKVNIWHKEISFNFKNYLWAENLELQVETLIAANMLKQGYYLITISGGWIVESVKDSYQINNSQCTCKDYLYRKQKCKHLIFKDWHLNYRAQCNQKRMKTYSSNE